MSLEKRLEYLEKAVNPSEYIYLVVYRSTIETIQDEEIIKKHKENVKNYIEKHPEIWDSITPQSNMKLLTVLVDKDGWTLNTAKEAQDDNVPPPTYWEN